MENADAPKIYDFPGISASENKIHFKLNFISFFFLLAKKRQYTK